MHRRAKSPVKDTTRQPSLRIRTKEIKIHIKPG